MTSLTQDLEALDALLTRCRETDYVVHHACLYGTGEGFVVTITGLAYFLPTTPPVVIAAPDRCHLVLLGQIGEPMASWVRAQLEARLLA
jgi:hypothetical protein